MCRVWGKYRKRGSRYDNKISLQVKAVPFAEIEIPSTVYPHKHTEGYVHVFVCVCVCV